MGVERRMCVMPGLGPLTHFCILTAVLYIMAKPMVVLSKSQEMASSVSFPGNRRGSPVLTSGVPLYLDDATM